MRFSSRKINYKLIFVLLALLISFIAAVIFGNYLSKKVENSKNTTTDSGTQNIIVPSLDKVLPNIKLNAFYADLTDALPEVSLSQQTEVARQKGNALYIELTDAEGRLTYSSELSTEILYPHNEKLTLSRLKNHFEYYNDYALGYFMSAFSSNIDDIERTRLQANELSLLSEAAHSGFSQLVVEFGENISKNDILHYQSYLLNLKLLCEGTSIGIKLPLSFVESAANHGTIAELMKIADFYVIDLGNMGADEISDTLSSLVYFSERYNAVAIVSEQADSPLSERIAALEKKGIYNFIVK
jgi:hypothetical protein